MRRLMLSSVLVGITALIAVSARAADCGDKMTQADMNACFGSEYTASDKELNANYRKIEQRLFGDLDTKKLLVASQRAWIAFRDAECKFSASEAEGGSVYPTILAACLTALTDARNKDFETFLSCEEGDLSCPVPSGN